ncbi:MAG: N-acetyltransferase [Paraprevotella sp.]|nr:N-acetyltransferase [Paraprevotella sp.]
MEKECWVRPTAPCEYEETERVTRDAFWNYYAPGCYEHYLLHRMRNCPDLLRELDLVAVADGKVAANSVCMKARLLTDEGREVSDILTLGPIAVRPEFQCRGIGGRLIAHTKHVARDLGYRAILLCGDPEYYVRQGFVPAETFGIRNAENFFMDALLACELFEGALSGMGGRYFEHEIYQIDPDEAETFDRTFPYKEKRRPDVRTVRLAGEPMQESLNKKLRKFRKRDLRSFHDESRCPSVISQASCLYVFDDGLLRNR